MLSVSWTSVTGARYALSKNECIYHCALLAELLAVVLAWKLNEGSTGCRIEAVMKAGAIK